MCSTSSSLISSLLSDIWTMWLWVALASQLLVYSTSRGMELICSCRTPHLQVIGSAAYPALTEWVTETWRGIMSRICRLRFVNTTFKVGPSSKSHASGGLTCLRSGTWSLRFYRVPPFRCYWLGSTHHCPKVDAQKCPKHSKIRKSRQWVYALLFFLGISYSFCLERPCFFFERWNDVFCFPCFRRSVFLQRLL